MNTAQTFFLIMQVSMLISGSLLAFTSLGNDVIGHETVCDKIIKLSDGSITGKDCHREPIRELNDLYNVGLSLILASNIFLILTLFCGGDY